MNIKCKCGELVAKGEINIRENRKGVKKKKFDMSFFSGTIVRNNSRNPKDWTGLCPKCQKEKSK